MHHGFEGVPQLGLPAPVRELGHEWDDVIALPALDAAAIHAADLGDPLRHLLEHVARFEGRIEDLGHLEEGAGLRETLGGLGIEAGVADGHRRLRDEAFEQLALVGAEPERRPPAQRQDAQELVLENDGNAEEAREAVLPPPRLGEQPAIAHDVRNGQGLALHRHHPDGALTEGNGPERVRRPDRLVRKGP